MGDETAAAEHRDRINQFLARFGDERDVPIPPLSADGIARVQRGSAVVSIHVVPAQGVLLLLSKVMEVPPGDPEPLYRRLLELSFLTTGDAAFAIDKATNFVYLRALRRLEGLDYDEFEDLVHTVASVADQWDDALRTEFG